MIERRKKMKVVDAGTTKTIDHVRSLPQHLQPQHLQPPTHFSKDSKTSQRDSRMNTRMNKVIAVMETVEKGEGMTNSGGGV
jgi:hypothetical protein